uniref:IS200/IS605 family transposase n=1 Tax=Dyadobacter sp. OTU695 TaxID=3043860 RepID=UPI00313BD5A0
MANTYLQVHLHFIFAPKYRQILIRSDWETDLYKYITGIVEARQHKMIAINGMSDHLHMLVGFRTPQSVADFMQDVKADSSQ